MILNRAQTNYILGKFAFGPLPFSLVTGSHVSSNKRCKMDSPWIFGGLSYYLWESFPLEIVRRKTGHIQVGSMVHPHPSLSSVIEMAIYTWKWAHEESMLLGKTVHCIICFSNFFPWRVTSLDNESAAFLLQWEFCTSGSFGNANWEC